ncbi:MAG: class II fructose-1,6-bisphosphate aldolase [Bacilli bacterium]
MLVNSKGILNEAKKGNYAVASFNINNLEWTKAILTACENEKSPVILGVSEGAAKYMGGFVAVNGMVRGLIESMNITVPVALHLDHGTSFDSCKSAIDAGFTSVMIDASKFCLDENIKITSEVVNYAKKYDVSVEAELGHVGGNEDGVIGGILYADKDECVKLVNEAKIDMLAPALGSVHGPYKGEPKLGFEEMLEISKATNIGLVLHGGSGIPSHQIKKSIELGTVKINVNTELQIEFTKIVRDVLKNDDKIYDPRKYIGPGMQGCIDVCVEKIRLFGSNNKS